LSGTILFDYRQSFHFHQNSTAAALAVVNMRVIRILKATKKGI